ncbi:hypothetical protein [Micromonospora carbonacea]|uniref:hypothetical protein n=1 Tax=Micromonospora carbonacea TaxID=47853 RepID=UPI00159F09D4|nr:hypothetical protein [Micromonospora carbonacea]
MTTADARRQAARELTGAERDLERISSRLDADPVALADAQRRLDDAEQAARTVLPWWRR